jgi:hypothetical protein
MLSIVPTSTQVKASYSVTVSVTDVTAAEEMKNLDSLAVKISPAMGRLLCYGGESGSLNW